MTFAFLALPSVFHMFGFKICLRAHPLFDHWWRRQPSLHLTCAKVSPRAFSLFRCTARRGPERRQIPGTLLSGPRPGGDRPGCWSWRRRLPGGQTPVMCSVTLWMTSWPWPAVWADPVGSRCSACTPSAGSGSVCCRLLWDGGRRAAPSAPTCLCNPLPSFLLVLLPQQVGGNLARLRSCVEELRSIPGEGRSPQEAHG